MYPREYFLGGHAIFTIQHDERHYTYQIRNLQLPDKILHFVYVRTGKEFIYIGMLNDHVVLTKASKFTTQSTAYKVINWLWGLIRTNKPLPEGYKLLHNGHCGVCGKVLTNPKSIELGIGPMCAVMKGIK